jgi:hypothetical protein
MAGVRTKDGQHGAQRTLDPALVERVAKALFRASMHHDKEHTQWSGYSEETHEYYRVLARAAIRAVRRG